MRLTRDDVAPVLAIMLGGTLSLVAIAGVVVPRWYQERIEVYLDQQAVEVEVPEIEILYRMDMLDRRALPVQRDSYATHVPFEVRPEAQRR